MYLSGTEREREGITSLTSFGQAYTLRDLSVLSLLSSSHSPPLSQGRWSTAMSRRAVATADLATRRPPRICWMLVKAALDERMRKP